MKNLKNLILFIFVGFAISSCYVNSRSIVDKNIKDSYDSVLIVIIYPKYTARKFKKLKEKLSLQFVNTKTKFNYFLIDDGNNRLELNPKERIDKAISDEISNINPQLVLFFNITHITFMNGAIRYLEFKITGVNPKNGLEVWKSFVNIENWFDIGGSWKIFAEDLYLKLKTDKIIK